MKRGLVNMARTLGVVALAVTVLACATEEPQVGPSSSADVMKAALVGDWQVSEVLVVFLDPLGQIWESYPETVYPNQETEVRFLEGQPRQVRYEGAWSFTDDGLYSMSYSVYFDGELGDSQTTDHDLEWSVDGTTGLLGELPVYVDVIGEDLVQLTWDRDTMQQGDGTCVLVLLLERKPTTP